MVLIVIELLLMICIAHKDSLGDCRSCPNPTLRVHVDGPLNAATAFVSVMLINE